MNKQLASLVKIIREIKINCNFTIIEVGALKIQDKKEPFYELMNYFPSSKIIGFELEKQVCDEMNLHSPQGVNYYPYALGKANEKRKLYITQNPMCTSLYKPNEKLLKLYNNFDSAYLKKETEIETISLDYFVDQNNIGDIDFIKIDVQGAELDVFQGGKKSLSNVLKIVCEVEFVPHYENQPLFGDVCNYLNQYDLMFNKFLKLSGRTLKPITLNNNSNFASQHFWTDAVFIHHVEKIHKLTDLQLIKLSLLACVYSSMDLTFYCLLEYDNRHSTNFAKNLMTLIAKENN